MQPCQLSSLGAAMKVFSRVLVALVAALAGLFAGTGTASAELDNQMSLVDGGGRTMTVQQWDTFLDGVFPLDRNRLTREWFHSGKARYSVVGPGADEFAGTLELGYQVGFPWSLGVGINFSYTTPNILLDDVSLSPLAFDPIGSVITPNLFPGVSISSDLGNGPHPGGGHLLRRRRGAGGLGGGGQRPRHRDRRRRRCAAASVRPPDRQNRRQRHHLRRTLEHELGRVLTVQPASRAAAAATRSSVAVSATRTNFAPPGP